MWVAGNDDVLARKFVDLWPHLNERQRRLVVGAEAKALGRGVLGGRVGVGNGLLILILVWWMRWKRLLILTVGVILSPRCVGPRSPPASWLTR